MKKLKLKSLKNIMNIILNSYTTTLLLFWYLNYCSFRNIKIKAAAASSVFIRLIN